LSYRSRDRERSGGLSSKFPLEAWTLFDVWTFWYVGKFSDVGTFWYVGTFRDVGTFWDAGTFRDAGKFRDDGAVFDGRHKSIFSGDFGSVDDDGRT